MTGVKVGGLSRISRTGLVPNDHPTHDQAQQIDQATNARPAGQLNAFEALRTQAPNPASFRYSPTPASDPRQEACAQVFNASALSSALSEVMQPVVFLHKNVPISQDSQVLHYFHAQSRFVIQTARQYQNQQIDKGLLFQKDAFGKYQLFKDSIPLQGKALDDAIHFLEEHFQLQPSSLPTDAKAKFSTISSRFANIKGATADTIFDDDSEIAFPRKGDLQTWRAMRERLKDRPLPRTREDLRTLVDKTFREVTGRSLFRAGPPVLNARSQANKIDMRWWSMTGFQHILDKWEAVIVEPKP